MEVFGIASVASISAICYLVAQAIKATPLDNKWLPAICGVVGLVLGLVGLYVVPNFPAQDILSAGAIGVASGLAATGANQIYKQLKGNEYSEMEESDDEEKE